MFFWNPNTDSQFYSSEETSLRRVVRLFIYVINKVSTAFVYILHKYITNNSLITYKILMICLQNIDLKNKINITTI